MNKIKIDESKIVKGQMPYVIKLMKMAQEKEGRRILDLIKNFSYKYSSSIQDETKEEVDLKVMMWRDLKKLKQKITQSDEETNNES